VRGSQYYSTGGTNQKCYVVIVIPVVSRRERRQTDHECREEHYLNMNLLSLEGQIEPGPDSEVMPEEVGVLNPDSVLGHLSGDVSSSLLRRYYLSMDLQAGLGLLLSPLEAVLWRQPGAITKIIEIQVSRSFRQSIHTALTSRASLAGSNNECKELSSRCCLLRSCRSRKASLALDRALATRFLLRLQVRV
jgi:hypothetical protein